MTWLGFDCSVYVQRPVLPVSLSYHSFVMLHWQQCQAGTACRPALPSLISVPLFGSHLQRRVEIPPRESISGGSEMLTDFLFLRVVQYILSTSLFEFCWLFLFFLSTKISTITCS